MHYYTDTDLSLTERAEALRLQSYQDGGGVWTNGYGHTGPEVGPGQTITPYQAELWLRADIAVAAATVNKALKVDVTQHQFNALTDFAFNVGGSAFRKSTLLEKVNANDLPGAELEFNKWVFVKGTVNKGLWNRRQAELAEFHIIGA